jgi:hypothetical protein
MCEAVLKPHSSQAQWLKFIILATHEVEIGRVAVQGQLGQKVNKTPFQPIKAQCSGTCLFSQLCGKHK